MEESSPSSIEQSPSLSALRFVHFLPALFVAALGFGAMGAIQGWSGEGAFGGWAAPGAAGLILGSCLGFTFGMAFGAGLVGGMLVLCRWMGRSKTRGFVACLGVCAVMFTLEGWPGILDRFVNPLAVVVIFLCVCQLVARAVHRKRSQAAQPSVQSDASSARGAGT
jgi:hypothetical protein